MKKIRIIIIAAVLIMAGIMGIFIKANWIPGKYAVKEGDFDRYKPYILVQEVHYTGSGWVQTGDESGFFSQEEYADIDLVNGSVLPQMDIYDEEYANIYLCEIEYKGKTKHAVFEDEIDSYYIVDWHPVYPVLRDTILPEWLYPKGFMTKKEAGRTSEKTDGVEPSQKENDSINMKDLFRNVPSSNIQELSFYVRKARMAAEDEAKKVCADIETPVEKEVELKEPYAQAYYTFLKEESDPVKENRPLRFRLAYIDDDDTPELLLMKDNSHPAGVWVYTYKNGRVVEVGEFGSIGGMQYLEKRGMIFSGFYNMGEGFSQFYMLKDGTAEKICEFHDIDVEAFTEPVEPLYEIDNVPVSETEYNEKFNELWSDDFISVGYNDGVVVEDIKDLKRALAREIEDLEIETKLTADLDAGQLEALEAYSNFLIVYRPGFSKELSDRADTEWEYTADYEDSEGPKFTLLYLDGDEIPELAVVYGLAHAHGIYLYTYTDGKVKQVGESSYGQYGGVGYMEKEGIIFSGYDNHGNLYDSVYRMDGTKTVLLQESGERWVDEEDEEGQYVYEVNGKETTLEEYLAANEKWNASEEKIATYDRAFCVPDGNIEGSVNRAMISLLLGREEYLKEKVLFASGCTENEILRFEYDDFDRDGSYEAFVFLGERIETEQEEYYKGQFWFVSGKQCVELEDENVYRYIDGITEGNGPTYIYFVSNEYSTHNLSKVWTVKEGEAVESAISGIGEVKCDRRNELEIWIDAYDMVSDGKEGERYGHTCKPYFYRYSWADDEFVRYESREISKEWLKHLCGFDLGTEIEAEGYEILSILEQKNGIVVVNYAMPSSEDGFSGITYDNVFWDCAAGDYWKKDERGVTSWKDAGFGGTY